MKFSTVETEYAVKWDGRSGPTISLIGMPFEACKQIAWLEGGRVIQRTVTRSEWVEIEGDAS